MRVRRLDGGSFPGRRISAGLILVRHGETEGQSSIRYHGRTDVALSELGREQMRAVRAAIEQIPGSLDFERVFSSPLVRATEGARLIAGHRKDLSIVEEFAEVDFGRFEGLTAEEIREQYPEDFAQWNVNRLAATYTYPGGESRAAFAERIFRGIDQMLKIWRFAERSPSRSLLVAHRGVIRTIVHRLTGESPVVELGSIQVIEHQDGRWSATALDQTAHLKP